MRRWTAGGHMLQPGTRHESVHSARLQEAVRPAGPRAQGHVRHRDLPGVVLEGPADGGAPAGRPPAQQDIHHAGRALHNLPR